MELLPESGQNPGYKKAARDSFLKAGETKGVYQVANCK